MRIAIIGFNDFIHEGRLQRIAYSLKKEHSVHVFGVENREYPYPQSCEGVPVSIIHLKSKKLSRHPAVQVLKYAEYYARTYRAVHLFRPDALLVVDPITLPFALLFKALGIPYVYCANEFSLGTSNLQAYNAILFKALLMLEKPGTRKAYRSFTVNDSIAREMEQHYRIPKPLLIRNIPDLEWESVTELDGEDVLRKAAEIDPHIKIVIHVGGMTINRGLHNLVRSVPMWQPGSKLVFLGYGYLKDDLEALRDELGMQERIVFLDPVPQNEVLAYTACADAGIVSFENTCMNYYYGLPNKFFQTGLVGVPLLTSAFPEMQTIVEEYNLGATFDPSSPEDIARAVNELLGSGFRIASDDLARFCRDFIWKNEEKKLLGIFSSLQKGLDSLAN